MVILLCGVVQVVFLDSLDESPEALQQQGDKHLAAHQYKEAVACYDKALLALQQQQQQQQGRQPKANAPAELCQMLLSVLLNLSASHLQLQQPMHALLYATAAAALSSHKSSKAYYRAAVALDRILGSASRSRSSSSSSSGTVAALGPAGPARLAAVATALMEGSVSLEGKTTPEAKAQMMAALTYVAAIQSKGGQASSSKKRVAEDGEWQLVCDLLSGAAAELAGCFNSSSSTPGSSSSSSRRTQAAAAAKTAGKEKELGNTAFKQGGFTIALQHYQASLASLQSSLGPIPTLLSSRAKAWLQQPSKHSQQHACMDGLAAALLDPKECAAGGFHTAAVALLQLDETAGARELCELGLQLLPDATELQELLQRIRTAAAAATAAAQASGSSGSSAGSSGSSRTSGGSNSKSGKAKQGKKQASSSSSAGSSSSSCSSSSDRRPVPMTEREMKNYMQKGTLGVEQLGMVNQFAELAARMGRGGRAGGRGGRAGARGRGGDMADALFEMCRLDDRVPNLREEFAKAGR
jgi:tetratricopeptide (TPR) repeat protein